jgi:hypothetical protein
VNDGKITAAKLSACMPYVCDRGEFLQLPSIEYFQYTITNDTGAYLSVPGLEHGFPAEFDFLVKGICSIASVAYSYARIQWPTGRYFSQVPVDLFNFGGTGRNGRRLTIPEFIRKNEVVRLELGTQAASTTLQIFFEGAILIPLSRSPQPNKPKSRAISDHSELSN